MFFKACYIKLNEHSLVYWYQQCVTVHQELSQDHCGKSQKGTLFL